MRLVSLKIFKKTDGFSIREVYFKKEGLSLIVDLDSVEGKSGNNIGKSTFAKLIDICLGAKTAKSIYYDPETKEDSPLKDFIETNKICAELVVEMKDGKLHFLQRELWDGGKCKLDGVESKTISDYQEKLKKLIFSDAPEKISFRSLIPFFIRVGNNASELFKYNGPFTKSIQLGMLYEYFVGPQISSDACQIASEQSNLAEQNKKILSKCGIKNIDEIDSLIDACKKEIDETIAKIRSPETVKDFADDKKNESLIANMEELEEKKYDLDLQISTFKEKIEDESISSGAIDRQVLDLLYKDGKTFVPELKRTFEDFVSFHEDMVSKRIERFNRRIDSLQKEADDVEKKLSNFRSTFNSEYVDYKYKVDGRANEGIDGYLEKKAELKILEASKSEFKENEEKIRKNSQRIIELGKEKEANNKNKEKLCILFQKHVEQILGRKISLSFQEKGMPITCNAGKVGDGRKKVLVACLVFSMIEINSDSGREFPNFFVQDAMEQVSGSDFFGLAKASLNTHCQYIIPILKDKIPTDEDFEESIVLTLSQKEKLFKF